MYSSFFWRFLYSFFINMNKNTTILLGAIAVLAIGAGAYMSMSKPTNEWFTTQSFRKTVQSQPTTTVTDWGNEDDGDAAWITVKHYSNWDCSITFDDWETMNWYTSKNQWGTCCRACAECTCYNWREPWVTDVTYETQPAEKKVMADENYY